MDQFIKDIECNFGMGRYILDDEVPESFLVENFSFHQSPRLSDFPIDLLIAYQRGNVVSAPRCPVDIPRVTPSDRDQLNVSDDIVLV